MSGKTYAIAALALVLLLQSGCAAGLLTGTLAGDLSNANQNRSTFNGTIWGGIYSHTVEPLTFNPHPTEIEQNAKEGVGRINQIQYPLTSAISVRLGKNGLGDVAKEHGIESIYYADIERWSALFGLWSMDVVHIYGR
jgi:hypothetical protein